MNAEALSLDEKLTALLELNCGIMSSIKAAAAEKEVPELERCAEIILVKIEYYLQDALDLQIEISRMRVGEDQSLQWLETLAKAGCIVRELVKSMKENRARFQAILAVIGGAEFSDARAADAAEADEPAA